MTRLINRNPGLGFRARSFQSLKIGVRERILYRQTLVSTGSIKAEFCHLYPELSLLDMLIMGVWFWVLSIWLPVSENWGKDRHGDLLEGL